MKMVDLHESDRKQALKALSKYVDSPQYTVDRVKAAREQLGSRYLLAPCNRVQRRLVPYGSVR